MISFSTVSCTWTVDLSHVAPNRSLSAQVTTSIAMVTAYYNNMLSWCPLMCCMVWATCEHVHKGRQWPLTSAESGLPSKVEQLSVPAPHSTLEWAWANDNQKVAMNEIDTHTVSPVMWCGGGRDVHACVSFMLYMLLGRYGVEQWLSLSNHIARRVNCSETFQPWGSSSVTKVFLWLTKTLEIWTSHCKLPPPYASLWRPPCDIHYCSLIGGVLNWYVISSPTRSCLFLDVH